jgi:hypothetical protein
MREDPVIIENEDGDILQEIFGDAATLKQGEITMCSTTSGKTKRLRDGCDDRIEASLSKPRAGELWPPSTRPATNRSVVE